MNNLSRIFETPHDLQIVFQSVGCQWRENGSCIMCSYGRAKRNLTPNEVLEHFDSAIAQMVNPQQVLILDCYGSILDEREFPAANLEILLRQVSKTSFHRIVFETRFETINEDIIRKIQQALGDKQIAFEFGLESAFPMSRRKINKHIGDAEFWDKVELAHQMSCEIVINLLLGIPGMTTREQIRDCADSVNMCTDKGADEVVVFPINIKQGTLLYEKYLAGAYQPVFHWQLIEVLNTISSESLGRVWLAYYGNKGDGIKQICCDGCREDLQDFYAKFLQGFDADERRRLVVDLLRKYIAVPCECFGEYTKIIY